MRVLLLLILAVAVAYFTVPTRGAHETALRAFMDAEAQQNSEAVQGQQGISLDSIVDFATGMLAGRGRYENYVLASKFTVDAPGAAYVECWGAFTLVQCRRVDRAAGEA